MTCRRVRVLASLDVGRAGPVRFRSEFEGKVYLDEKTLVAGTLV
jgi:hypothetical protein